MTIVLGGRDIHLANRDPAFLICFWFDKWYNTFMLPRVNNVCCKCNLSNPKPGHTSGWSGRGARRGGGAGSGRTGCQQNCSPRGQASLAPPKATKTRRLKDTPEARTSEILCKPMEEQNLPSPKPGHTTSGSGRGGAWPGRKGRRRSGSPRRHLTLAPTRYRRQLS